MSLDVQSIDYTLKPTCVGAMLAVLGAYGYLIAP
jgi:hypothetical protein